MSNIKKAEDMFKDLPQEIKEKIFKIAEGKTVYFPKQQKRERIDKEEVLEVFLKSRGITYKKLGERFNLTAARICQIINEEKKSQFKERINYWHNQKEVSLRTLAEFYDRSHETIRQKGGKGGKNRAERETTKTVSDGS